MAFDPQQPNFEPARHDDFPIVARPHDIWRPVETHDGRTLMFYCNGRLDTEQTVVQNPPTCFDLTYAALDDLGILEASEGDVEDAYGVVIPGHVPYFVDTRIGVNDINKASFRIFSKCQKGMPFPEALTKCLLSQASSGV